MVLSTRGRCNDDAMKFFRPDKKKNGCIGGSRYAYAIGIINATMMDIASLTGQKILIHFFIRCAA